METYVPAMAITAFFMASLGLFLSGIAATKQARMAKKLFKMRCEELNREKGN